MKVLFLDIDGVVNCRTTKETFGPFIGIDRKLAGRVKRIIKQTGCKVVLSSSWRLDHPFEMEVRDKVCDLFGMTGQVFNNGAEGTEDRGDEVNFWLADCKEPIERYAILDDTSEFYPDQNLFKTEFETGLTPEITESVIAFLNDGIRCPDFKRQIEKYKNGKTKSKKFAAVCQVHKKIETYEYSP